MTAPSKVPAASPDQYHRGSRTPATANTPVTRVTVKATTPISELGNPKTDACQVVITDPQEITGLMLQVGT